jgi:hypothetical protein
LVLIKIPTDSDLDLIPVSPKGLSRPTRKLRKRRYLKAILK